MPNRNYDPEKGHRLYNRYLDELEYGEELGFDVVAVNEHHQTAYGLMPSPIVTASALARRTKRVKIAILGSALPLRSHPLMVAEEHAMIDVISGGRLITGFVRGIGAEYHTFGVNPTFSHDRFHEAHDLIVRAWTEPGPFSFQGHHYRVRYVNLWPRPYQKPHPPIWIPSQGSKETIDWASHPDRRYAAHVVKLYPQVDRQKGTLRVEVQIEKPDDFLWPDMSARITFTEPLPAADGHAGVLVPRAAIHGDGDTRFVWTVLDGRARRIPVALGRDFGDQVQITKGLDGGETVVVGTPGELRDGQTIRVAGGA